MVTEGAARPEIVGSRAVAKSSKLQQAKQQMLQASRPAAAAAARVAFIGV